MREERYEEDKTYDDPNPPSPRRMLYEMGKTDTFNRKNHGPFIYASQFSRK